MSEAFWVFEQKITLGNSGPLNQLLGHIEPAVHMHGAHMQGAHTGNHHLRIIIRRIS